MPIIINQSMLWFIFNVKDNYYLEGMNLCNIMDLAFDAEQFHTVDSYY